MVASRFINRDSIAQTGILPSGLQLFQDVRPLEIVDVKKAITESITGQKVAVMRCTGIFQRADEKNANGRVYPLPVIREAIEKIQPAIKARRVMGEFDHPPDAKIHLDRISHIITKLVLDNKTVLGEIEVINEDRCPCGNMLACYLDRGIQIGISSRGVGDMELIVHEDGDAYQVQEGYEFITFDAVAEPSVQGTQLKRITESRERERRQREFEMNEVRERLLLSGISKFLKE